MCTPGAAIFTTILSTGVAVYSANEQARYNKEVAANNAVTAEYQAVDAIERGELAEKQSRLATQKLIGQQKAAIAGSGFTLDADSSAGDVIADTAALGEEDVYAIRSNAAREAWSFRVQGTNALAQGQLAVAEGRSKAAGSLLEGSSSVAAKWSRYKKLGY
jgi:hypothetical protein